MIASELYDILKKYPNFDVVFTSDGEESIYVGPENVNIVFSSEEIFIDVGKFKYNEGE